MHLIKSFNQAYLKENIKKSKGLILLFLILVPIFTALVLIFNVNSSSIEKIVSNTQIAWVNLVGMYVIPLVLSFALFGYVYNKKSVDFINAMPMNKKTIFITNTIGGILLITLMQVITAIVVFACGMFCKNIFIFYKMIIDIFVVMWVSYVFVFLATNLAMTFSGTFLTQIVLTMLILFLVPFCLDSYMEFSTVKNCVFESSAGNFAGTINSNKEAYTMPYRAIWRNYRR